MRKIFIGVMLLISMTGSSFATWSSKYSMLTEYATRIADAIKVDIDEHTLTDGQIYTYLSSLVSYDNRIWSATIGFSPEFFKNRENRQWWISKQWQNNYKQSRKELYAPYVWRNMDNLLTAADIGDLTSNFGYDYTDTKWDWWHRTMESQKPTWSGPYSSNLTGHSMITYSVPIRKDAVLSFNVWYNP